MSLNQREINYLAKISSEKLESNFYDSQNFMSEIVYFASNKKTQ